MSLPRFSSGSFGRLSFEHMNLICDTVERVRPLLVNNALQGGAASFELLVAKITAQGTTVNGAHQWQEVELQNRDFPTSRIRWQDKVDGRKSYAPTDGDKYQPAYAIPTFDPLPFNNETLFEVGSVHVLFRTKGKDGKVAWLSVSSVPSGSLPFPAKIISSAPLGGGIPGTSRRWVYDFVEVEWTQNNQTGGEWTTVPGGRAGSTIGTALNGCEINNQVPFGGSGPGSVGSLPIANGVVVSMGYEKGNLPFFSLPNPLSVNCNP